jgi:hypothetical protein
MATHTPNIPGAGNLFPLSSENHLSAIRAIRVLKFSELSRYEPRNPTEYLSERPEMTPKAFGANEGLNKKRKINYEEAKHCKTYHRACSRRCCGAKAGNPVVFKNS